MNSSSAPVSQSYRDPAQKSGSSGDGIAIARSDFRFPGCNKGTVDGSEIRRSPVEHGVNMMEISQYLQGFIVFIHVRWCRISSINSSNESKRNPSIRKETTMIPEYVLAQ